MPSVVKFGENGNEVVVSFSISFLFVPPILSILPITTPLSSYLLDREYYSNDKHLKTLSPALVSLSPSLSLTADGRDGRERKVCLFRIHKGRRVLLLLLLPCERSFALSPSRLRSAGAASINLSLSLSCFSRIVTREKKRREMHSNFQSRKRALGPHGEGHNVIYRKYFLIIEMSKCPNCRTVAPPLG